MHISDALHYIRNTKGKFFSVRFIKRSDGSVREMNARTGVKKHLVKNPSKSGIDFKKNDLISVYDVKEEGYRSIPMEGIREIKIGDEWIKVEPLTKEEGELLELVWNRGHALNISDELAYEGIKQDLETIKKYIGA